MAGNGEDGILISSQIKYYEKEKNRNWQPIDNCKFV